MRRFETRVERLEKRCTPQARQYELVVRYYGGEERMEDDTWSLTIWVHQPWCMAAGHLGACGQCPPEED